MPDIRFTSRSTIGEDVATSHTCLAHSRRKQGQSDVSTDNLPKVGGLEPHFLLFRRARDGVAGGLEQTLRVIFEVAVVDQARLELKVETHLDALML